MVVVLLKLLKFVYVFGTKIKNAQEKLLIASIDLVSDFSNNLVLGLFFLVF